MNISKFFKSHKLFVFCLIFSFCLCFIRPISSFASSDYSLSIGTYIDGEFVDYPIPRDDLLTISDLLIQETDFPLTYQEFVNILDSLSLTSFFEYWDPNSPSYYIDVFYYPSNSSISISFSKSLFSGVSSSVSSNFVFLSGSSYYSGFTPFFLPFSLPIGSRSASYGMPYLLSSYSPSVNFSSTFSSNLLSYNSLLVGSSYSSNFGSFVSAFLSSDDYPTCSILIKYSSNHTLSVAHIGLGYSVSHTYSLFNCNPLLTSSDLSVATGGGLTFSVTPPFSISGAFPYCRTSSFSYSTLNHGLVISDVPFVTPTPIPSPDWVTPTPFPTVTLSPIDVTPIPQYLDPNVLGSDGNISDLNGFAGLLDQTFSNFDIFSLGSSILEYVYSFSGYFSFILIIPVICLIAFALGRLNQK